MWDQFYINTKLEANYSSAHMNIYIFGSETKKAFGKYMCFKMQYSPQSYLDYYRQYHTTTAPSPILSIQQWQTTITTTLICEWKFVKKNTWHKNWSRSSFNLTSLFCCILRASGSTFLFCSTNFAVICCFNKHVCFYQSSTLLRFYHPHTTSRIKRSLQKFPIRTRKEVERTG